MSAALPWLCVSLAILLTAASHVVFKLYSMTRRLHFAVLTGLGFVCVQVLSFLALRQLTIAQVYLTGALVPVVTTLGARFLIGERVDSRHWIGLGVIVAGVAVYLRAVAA